MHACFLMPAVKKCRYACTITFAALIFASSMAQAQQKFDAINLLKTVKFLASDSLQGRKTGTPGNQAAREYIVAAFKGMALEPVFDSYTQPFSFESRREQGKRYDGINLIGKRTGQKTPQKYIVVSAHYDHVGMKNGEIYNGADDNASGVGALLAAIDYFGKHPPEHTIIFAAFDAEELGLQGARAFINETPVPRDSILLNINFDMVSRNAQRELYAVGTSHYPQLKPFVEAVAAEAKIHVLFGHDTKGEKPGDDWTSASDHGPFHRANIPFIYFGVEDHPDYHKPSDDYENIDPAFYIDVVDFLIDAVAAFDKGM